MKKVIKANNYPSQLLYNKFEEMKACIRHHILFKIPMLLRVPNA